MTSTSPSRLSTGLLIAITVLLAALVIGLAVAGFLALRVVPEAMGVLKEMRQELKATRAATQELSAEVERMKAIAAEAATQTAQRQKALRTELQARSRRTQEELEGIARRRGQIPEHVSINPLTKLDAVIDLNTIMADEILILNRHLAETQADLAEALAPLPIQGKAKGKDK